MIRWEPVADDEPIRVAIIDDDRVLMDGLKRLIDDASGFSCTSVFGSVEEALPLLAAARPHILLLDIQLPGMPGNAAIDALRRQCPGIDILMLTVFSDRANVFTSICNGANGYLLKSTPPPRLLDAIRAVRAGGSPLSPEIARQIVTLFQKTGKPQSPAQALTANEERLLALLSEGYSYEAAGLRMNISINTVRNYVRSIYDKLHVHSKSEAVSKALRQGLI
jgi:DNA-binding NarL/FixJ family response regulator